MVFLMEPPYEIPKEVEDKINQVQQEVQKPKLNRLYITSSPVIVYSREAANRLLQQGFQIIAVEKNLKRDGDASIFLFAPDNGKTYSALCKILKEMNESKNNLKDNLKKQS